MFDIDIIGQTPSSLEPYLVISIMIITICVCGYDNSDIIILHEGQLGRRVIALGRVCLSVCSSVLFIL